MPKLPGYPGRTRSRWLYLKSFLPVVVLLFLFSILLASYSLLSHFRSPAAKQRIGWQSWDVVEVVQPHENTNSAINGTDFNPSIPIDVWDPLAVHTTGLTEVIVKSCYFPPYLFPNYCAPASSADDDKAKGRWIIVDRDLNIRSGLWYLNIYYRRTRRLDTPLITDIRVVPDPAPDTLNLDGWVKASGDLHSGVWPSQDPARIWYKLQDGNSMRALQSFSSQVDEVITELDVVYGDDEPFYGFQRIQGGKVLEAKEGKWESVDIAYRRGNPITERVRPPKFHADGTLKIMQIADLHYSVGHGKCRDTDKTPCIGDADTAEWLAQVLEAEQPDLVVFSGDQLNGQETSYDSRSVLAKFARPVIDRKIPWCAVFGNHDSEIAEDRETQMRTLQNMPYSLARVGPKGVDGFGNYMIKLRSSDPSRMHIFTLYFLDSHDYQKRKLPWSKPEYDYIKPSQIDWFKNVSASVKPIERPFRPDGGADLGHIWGRSRFARQEERHLAKPNAMMWFHIPLPEAYNDADMADGEVLDVGDQLDGSGASKHNSGFFVSGIKQALQTDDETKIVEVKIISNGHCHNTDRCRRVDGVWMCFDGGSSFSGYGQLGFDRRVRIYQLSDYGEIVETYKHLTNGDIVDRQTLVGEAAPLYGDHLAV